MRYNQIMYRRDVGCRLHGEHLKKEILEEIWVRADAPHWIRYFRDDKGTGVEIRPAIVSRIATEDAPVSMDNRKSFYYPRSQLLANSIF